MAYNRKLIAIALLATCRLTLQAEENSLGDALVFHASFDRGPNADLAKGDGAAYTADSPSRNKITKGLEIAGVKPVAGVGRYGGALQFAKKTAQTVLFRAKDNVPYHEKGFSATVSFWLSLDPDKDLEPGYVDPIQITDKKWNDAAVWVDFTKDDKPRHFRLGVFSNLEVWNPKNIKWELFPAEKKPLVDVNSPPFTTGKWTHVVITLSKINAPDQSSSCKLYLDGKLQGTIAGAQRLTWDPDQLMIMLGIGYTGLFDDLAIFNKALDTSEVVELHKLDAGVSSLR